MPHRKAAQLVLCRKPALLSSPASSPAPHTDTVPSKHHQPIRSLFDWRIVNRLHVLAHHGNHEVEL